MTVNPNHNGVLERRITQQIVYGLVAAVVIGLSGWTLKTAKDLSVDVARVQQDELWIKEILVEQSRKINKLTPKADE